jgi:hypothetical protein
MIRGMGDTGKHRSNLTLSCFCSGEIGEAASLAYFQPAPAPVTIQLCHTRELEAIPGEC